MPPRRAWICALIVLGVAACHGRHHDARPLREAILGTWNIICATTDEHVSRCPGKDDRSTFYTFHAGGLVELGGGATTAAPDRGTWTLDGDRLDVHFESGPAVEDDHYRARLDDNQLVLWDAPRGFGTILSRAGAPVETEPRAVTPGGATSGALGDVHYTIDLPSGYQLTREAEDDQWWRPPGDGFVVELRGVTTSDCHDSVIGCRKKIDGVDREACVGVERCVDRNDYVECTVSHTRGWLEPGEHDAALALCRTFAIE